MEQDTTIPPTTMRACAQALRGQAPEDRQVTIIAVGLDGPLVMTGTVKDLAGLLADIHTEQADVCAPAVWAPSPDNPTQMVPLSYGVSGSDGCCQVTLTWPTGEQAIGYYTLPDGY